MSNTDMTDIPEKPKWWHGLIAPIMEIIYMFKQKQCCQCGREYSGWFVYRFMNYCPICGDEFIK